MQDGIRMEKGIRIEETKENDGILLSDTVVRVEEKHRKSRNTKHGGK